MKVREITLLPPFPPNECVETQVSCVVEDFIKFHAMIHEHRIFLCKIHEYDDFYDFTYMRFTCDTRAARAPRVWDLSTFSAITVFIAFPRETQQAAPARVARYGLRFKRAETRAISFCVEAIFFFFFSHARAKSVLRFLVALLVSVVAMEEFPCGQSLTVQEC